MSEPLVWTRTRRTCFIIRQFENWRPILSSLRRGEKPMRWVMRRGPEIHTNGEPTGLVKEIFVKKVYTPPGYEIRPSDVVVDIGANIGVFSMYAAGQGAAKVYSFEPGPETVAYLTKNAEVNGYRQIVPRWNTVANRTGMASLFLTGGHCSGGNRLFDAGMEGPRQSVEVPSITLPDLMDEHGLETIDLLKIDCEGAEGLILASTPPERLGGIRRIAMEFHDHLSPLRHEELQRLLEGAGFATRLGWDGKSRTGYIYARR